ncbi:hypothetical protein GYMLUDRAFT_65730 [Collybiopsis luxurians FD-317 M1]|nr:hypothetical protein GYMLUDRAFT_65730 [Collybiopsis luxurians FD-317 M1]
MSFRAILYAYIFGGFTFIPLLLCTLIAYTLYTSEPVSEHSKEKLPTTPLEDSAAALDVQDSPKSRKGWLTVRRTFEESTFDGGYVNLVRSFLDARSKDPKRSRPKDMWYVVLKGQILYLYEDEAMTECEAAIQLGSHNVVVYPEGLLDGELFTKRNALCLKPKQDVKAMPSLTREMKLNDKEEGGKGKDGEKARKVAEARAAAREQALNSQTPWFIFVRSTVEMEDWYFSLVHASQHPPQTPTLDTLQEIFLPADMNLLVSTLDEQPDVIPMRWFNALFGRIFYSFYKTEHLESFIIGRLMKKLSKVKRPNFLNDVLVTDVSVGNRTPVFSKPMLKELSKEGDASMEVHVAFKGEVRITIQATATINLGARFKPYNVKLVLAAVLRELEGNLLVKIKRPPSNRIWYAFTQTPKMVLNVEPVVSDRQITWGMILSTIESSLKTIIQESIVMPNMDDIAFFETVNRTGMNRGGIWAGAARKHDSNDISGGGQPAPSHQELPIQEPLISDSKNSAEPLPQPMQATQSLHETSSSTFDPPSVSSSSTFTEESSAENPNIRKKWFSSVRGFDTGTLSDHNGSDLEFRGRALDVDAQRSMTTRSHSTPKEETVSEQNESNDIVAPPYLGDSLVQQRSASQSSSIRESDTSSATNNVYTRNDTDGLSLAASAPMNSTPPSPTNFLTTLKNRDKQALSNSAKETMRKWGVKWGNLNKELSGSSSNSTGSQNEDMPDHDTVGEGSGFHSRSRTISALGGSLSGSQKPRASYAEVRAAVAERRERSEHSENTSFLSASDPIAIPALGSQNGRTSYNPSSESDSTSLLDRFTPEVIGGDIDAPYLASTSSSSSSKSTTINGEKPNTRLPANPDFSLDESVPTQSPIHVQPQSKTMSIPGIHASHRGEIMSLGFSPPQENKEKQRSRTGSQGHSTLAALGATSMGSLSKNPKIQTMYRLWKQASSNSNAESSDFRSQFHTDEVPEESPREASSPAASGSADDTNSTQSSVSFPPSMSSFSKPSLAPPLPPRPSPVTISPSRPPPLPSRTPSVAASRASSNTTSSYSPTSLEQSLLPSLPIVSSAQDALKEIATKDDHTRKRGSLSLSGSPPSPTTERRTSSAAVAQSPSLAREPQSNVDKPAALENGSAQTQANLESEVDAARAWGLDDDSISEGPD